jgi:hypothetical protein
MLYRKFDAEAPTLLLDESEAAFKSGEEYGEALRGILNTGDGRATIDLIENKILYGGQACKPDSPDDFRNSLSLRKLLNP